MAGSTGAQNNLRYAYFPGSRRLAIDVNGQVSVFDTGDHQIGGFSQQQSGDQSITFTSQFGLVRVNDLPQISPVTAPNASSAPPAVDNTVVNPPQPSSSLQQPAPFVPQPVQNTAMQNPSAAAMTSPMTSPSAMSTGGSAVVSKTAADDIFALIEKLSDLHKKGILTDSEYEAKKSDLLSRL